MGDLFEPGILKEQWQELVDVIPLDIDGTQLYQIKTTKNQLTKVTWDL